MHYIQSDLFNTDTEGTKLTKCPYYGGLRIIEVEFVWNLDSYRPNGLSVIERCPYYKERFDCTSLYILMLFLLNFHFSLPQWHYKYNRRHVWQTRVSHLRELWHQRDKMLED